DPYAVDARDFDLRAQSTCIVGAAGTHIFPSAGCLQHALVVPTTRSNTMNRRKLTTLFALSAGLAILSGPVLAQQKSLKEQLTGTWTIVSNDNTASNGTKRQPFGPNPKGYMVLSPEGRYVQILTNPDRPKFKMNSRMEGTPEENTAAVHATTATFGTWSVDEASKTLLIRNEGGMYPNQIG